MHILSWICGVKRDKIRNEYIRGNSSVISINKKALGMLFEMVWVQIPKIRNNPNRTYTKLQVQRNKRERSITTFTKLLMKNMIDNIHRNCYSTHTLYTQ